MKAYRFVAWRQPPELVEIAVPEPGPGQVLIKVGGAGACHSDLHLMSWPPLPWQLPFTLGHETAGWVVGIGEAAGGIEMGEAVAVYGPWGCGRCRNCRSGMENYCEGSSRTAAAGGGLGRDGGMAEYMLVPSSRLLVPLGDLDPASAAPLADAALTPYHAIKRSLHLLVPGSSAVVIGIGGLGHMALQILKALGPAHLIAVDVSEEKLELAREVGADEMVPFQRGAEAVRTAIGRAGAELVLDFVGSNETMAFAAQCCRTLGHLTIVGMSMGTLPLNFFAVPYETSVALTYWGSHPELIEVIALASSGKIQSHVEKFPLERADEAYDRLRSGTLRGRAVVVP